jgi:CPA2 family monovalent cation:H+ antiporter-2
LPHATPLIATLVAGICLAFLAGLVAHRFRLPPIAGYLLAGRRHRAVHARLRRRPEAGAELAEIGVILLMFGVGLHFSLKDLLSVRKRSRFPVRSARSPSRPSDGDGPLLDCWAGIRRRGFVFGLRLSVASTVVLLRALQERRMVETERGGSRSAG